MVSLASHYLPPDRLHEVATGEKLPLVAYGCALFADISGFTPVTEYLRAKLGARRGAEELATHLNRVYDVLVAQVERYNGSIIGFAGDAITCWFSGEASTARAVTCGAALLKAMQDVEQITLSDSNNLLLGLKVAIASGTTKRFVVGDPEIQLIDALAGAIVARMAVGEELAKRGELLIDAPTVEQFGEVIKIQEWRGNEPERFAVLESFEDPYGLDSLNVEPPTPPQELLLPWMLPALASHVQAGLGEFPIELRPVTALFLSFSGIDYDGDTDAKNKLDQFVRLAQSIVNMYGGNILQLTVGDKGSYMYAAFGAPFAHEDDPARALNAALDLRAQAANLTYLAPIRIGISQGIMRTGAYGGETRRTYGVLGDEVNLAARLMQKAAPGEIFISESVMTSRLDAFAFESLGSMPVKGKANPVSAFRLIAQRDRTFETRFYTTPMVGREDQLEQILAALQPLFEGEHAGVIYVYGEPGMGKSRLAFEAQRRLQMQADVRWMTGQADVLNRAPLNAFTYFLRPYFGQRREQDALTNQRTFDSTFEDLLGISDGANRADLITYRSYLAGMVGLMIPNSPYTIGDEKLRLDGSILAIKAWVRAVSSHQPLVVHLEDVQWLDESSVLALQNLTYNMENVPVVLLLTSRYTDEGTHITIENLESVPIHTIDLKRLDDSVIHAIAESVLAGRITQALTRFIGERAEGNPFFAEQLVLDLRERAVLIEDENGWALKTDAAAEVPSNINAVLIARLDRLAAQVRSVVQTASVLGREFDVQVLSRMLRESDYSAIQAAQSASIWTAIDTLRYLFQHALLRDAAYEMQVQERLKALHRIAAEAIETLYPDDPTQQEALLQHWHVAGDIDRELQYLDPIANRLTFMVHQYARAEHLVQRVLNQLEENDSRRAMPLNWMSALQYQRGNMVESQKIALQALALASQENRDTVATSLERIGEVAHTRGEYAEARRYIEQCIAIRQEIGDRRGVASLLLRLASIFFNKSDYVTARQYREESLAISQELNDLVGIASSLSALGDLVVNHKDNQGYSRASLVRA